MSIQVAESMVIDPTDTKRRPALTEDEARLLTSEIKQTTSRLWLLVTEAHDREAHVALNYATWDDYVRGELSISPSRSYQLLDTGHVMRAVASAGVDITGMQAPPARVVARIKHQLTAVHEIAAQAMRDGEPPGEALRALAKVPQQAEAADGDEEDESAPSAVRCPACHGDGKVSRSLASKLRKWVRSFE